MTTTTTNKTTTNGTTTQAAAQACCQGASDAMKTGMESNQKMFNMFTENMNKMMGMNPFVMPAMNMPVGTMPMAFEKMTKAMNSMVDSSARCMTECNTLMIDAMRNNARVMERTGDMVVGQMTGKSVKPMGETCREIMDEAMGFSNKCSERMVKMNTEHAQRVSMVIDEAMTCKTCN